MIGRGGKAASLRVVAPLFVILTTLLVAGLVSLLAVRERHAEIVAEAAARIRFEGAALVRDAERFFDLRPTVLREEVAFLGADPATESVAIFDDSGRCVFANRPEWVGQPAEALLDEHDQGLLRQMQVARVARVTQRSAPEPLLVYVAGFRIPSAAGELRGQRRGMLYLRRAPSAPGFVAAVMPTAAPVTLVTLLLALAAVVYVQLSVVRPLQRLGDATRVLADGSQPAIDATHGPAEVRRVAAAMQHMAGVVHAQIEETARRREFKRAVLDALHEAVVVADMDGRVVLANAAALALFGERCDPEAGGHADRLFADAAPLARARGGDAVVCRALHASGEPFWAELRSHSFDSFDGPVNLLVVRDVSEERRVDEELAAHRDRLEELVDSRTRELEEARRMAENASQAKSDFLAAVSHEIRTPLNGVVSLLELLGHTQLDAEQSEMVRVVQDSAGTLLDLIADMLDFSRIEAGRLDLASEPLSIEGEVGRVVRNLDALARERQVELRFCIDDGIPARTLGDPLRLRQVLANLLGNAIKFSSGLDHTGRVLLAVRCLGSDNGVAHLEFSVRDNGIGMRPEDQARIFAPFEQADTGIARRFGGTGLGLAIVRRLADAMQGELKLHSSPGLGSVFTLRVDLPVLSFEAPDPQPLAGLHCVVVGLPGGEAEGWARCLRRAGATVDRLHEVAALRAYVGQPRAASCAWVVTCVAAGEALRDRLVELRSQAPAPAPALLLLDDGPNAAPLTTIAGTRVLATRLLTGDVLVEALLELTDRRPRAAAEHHEPLPGATPVAAPRVMVVDDNPTNRLVVERQLAALGYRLRAFETAQAALTALESEGFDLVLSDLQMPGIDGLGFVRRIREMETRLGRRRLPVIAFTANALERERRRCLAAGMDDYLTKPVNLERLQQTLQRWLSTAADRAVPVAASDHTADGADVLATLRGFLGEDPQVLKDYLEVFSAELQAWPEALDEALGRDAVSRVAVLAHQVKSSARSVGSLELAHACEALERVALGGPPQSIRIHLRLVEGEIMRTAGRLARALASLECAGTIDTAIPAPSLT